MISFILMILFQALIAFLIGTVLFDAVHYVLHQCLKSNHKWLQAISHLHTPHHHFFTSNLKIDPAWMKRNLVRHVMLEYFIQMIGISSCLLFLQPIAVLCAAILATIITLVVFYRRGIDSRHMAYINLPSYRGGPIVTADYHALHHVHLNQFFSSYIKVIDYLLGTGHHLAGKRIAMTGASGALGSHLKTLLEKEGARITTFKFGVDYTYDNYEKLRGPLSQTDILLLCHGSKYDNAQQANCDSFINIIELYRSVYQHELVPIEIWGVGSEIEFHPCFGIKKLIPYAQSKRNFARKAREYFQARDMQYRHIVHSAFTSRMGPGLISAKFAAIVTLFLIKRGFKYVPVTYTGFAFLNYFRFALNK